MPRKRIQTAKLLDPGLHQDFEGLFYEELDSAFTAGIACCENCYDDFVRQWPGIYLHSTGFQESGIDLMNFYENSDFAFEFTPEEFKDRVQMQVRCERCGAPLTSWFWPYTLPFDPPDNFEKDTEEIAAIAKETPFLVLAHPLASKVYEQIKKAATSITPDDALKRLFRARRCSGLPNPTLEDFRQPPAEITADGRFNHSGLPVLYTATTADLAFAEIDSPEQGAYIAEIEVLRPCSLLNTADDLIDDDVIRAVFASVLVSAPPRGQGWSRPEYIFSRFIADCVRNAGLDGIKYASARKAVGANVVLFARSGDWSSIYRVSGFEKYTDTRKADRKPHQHATEARQA
jgi:RES domain-containing protein